MKVQKIVSLDEDTMRISQKMKNFSQWVRIGLRNYDQGHDLTHELVEANKQKAQWAKVANIFASTLVEKSVEMDENYKGSIEDLIYIAMKEVQKQTSLRDFE